MSATEIATWLVRAAALYAALGALVAVYVLAAGLKRFDEAAARAGWAFKLLIAPGIVALWPLIALRLRSAGPAVEETAHDRAARGGR